MHDLYGMIWCSEQPFVMLLHGVAVYILANLGLSIMLWTMKVYDLWDDDALWVNQ